MGKDSKTCAFYPLKEVFKAIDKGRIKIANFRTREKNRNTLRELGLTSDDAIRHIRSLNANHFKETSCLPGKVYADVYIKKINKESVYIKFFLDGNLVVLSFHKNEPRR